MEPQRAGDSKHRNREYMDSLSVEMRHIGSTRPDTTLSLYQKTLATPIMTLAEQDQAEIIKTDAGVIPIIKPYADNGLILERMKLAAETLSSVFTAKRTIVSLLTKVWQRLMQPKCAA